MVIKRHSRSVDVNKHCCGRCKSKLIEIEVSDSSGSAAGYTPKKARKTSEYALFVKHQTSRVRQCLASERKCKPNEVSQADVMKECGRLWRDEKDARNKASVKVSDDIDMMAGRLTGLSLNRSFTP